MTWNIFESVQQIGGKPLLIMDKSFACCEDNDQSKMRRASSGTVRRESEKSYWKALLLLIFGGFFGAHHLYLGRVDHALIYMFTGGGFLCGLFHDLWHLSRYVRWANFATDESFARQHLEKVNKLAKPAFSCGRWLAMFFLPLYVKRVVFMAIPEQLGTIGHVDLISAFITPSIISVVVWFVGNIGHIQGEFTSSLRVWAFGWIVFLLGTGELVENVFCLLVCYNFKRDSRYRTEPKKRGSFFGNAIIILAAILTVSALLASYCVFNCKITDPESGQSIECRVIIERHFGDAVRELRESLRIVYKTFREKGFKEGFRQLGVVTDLTGRQRAYEILELPADASWDDVKRANRMLLKKYHPDKSPSNGNDEERDQKYLEVQRAFELLKASRGEGDARGTKDDTSTERPSKKDSTSTERPSKKDSTSTERPSKKDSTSTERPSKKDYTSTEKTRAEVRTSTEKAKEKVQTTTKKAKEDSHTSTERTRVEVPTSTEKNKEEVRTSTQKAGEEVHTSTEKVREEMHSPTKPPTPEEETHTAMPREELQTEQGNPSGGSSGPQAEGDGWDVDEFVKGLMKDVHHRAKGDMRENEDTEDKKFRYRKSVIKLDPAPGEEPVVHTFRNNRYSPDDVPKKDEIIDIEELPGFEDQEVD